MATAAGSVPASTTVITDEQRRWVVIGICLNKLLTPVLRTVLGKQIPAWYNNLCHPPTNIAKQVYGTQVKKLLPSTVKLNYGNINKNYDNHKSTYGAYDYDVKDPESLAKLFVQPFMAKFTGFDQTMDLSAALTLIAETDPFHSSGAAAQANIVRSMVRNEWAHCDFSHWSELNYRTCIQHIELLVKKLNLSSADEKDFVNELNNWKDKGPQICCGQVVDTDLLKIITTEVSALFDSVTIWQEENQDTQNQLRERLHSVQRVFGQEIQNLLEIQSTMGKDIEELKVNYQVTSQQLKALENEVAKRSKAHQEIPCVFMLPDRTEWFSGRESELGNLHTLLQMSRDISEPKVQIASVCGLGGSGKTSLVAEYAHRQRDFYAGGVFWFSGEDGEKFANSVDKLAVYFGANLEATPDRTLIKTLELISNIQKPWLLVLDDMDQFKLSSNIEMLLSGSWKRRVKGSGHILITTRRKPKVMSQTIRRFKESQCLQLQCFSLDDGKQFVFRRTGILPDAKTLADAATLVETLEGLPLALEQACAYISSLPCSLPLYLQRYNQYSIRLLKDQDATPASLFVAKERLAVHTTWLLNFEYIKRSPHGKFAARFFYACAFSDPTEIQKELINPGKPAIEDQAYQEYVSSPLGSSHILKLLTDFSLFKESRSSLCVHRLVQEVIRDNFKPEEYVLSFVDAVRLLSHAFSCLRSPDELLTSMVSEHRDRASLQATNPSLFHNWYKMCFHTHEVHKLLLGFLQSSQTLDPRIVTAETARLVYECALHFNVNNKAADAKNTIDFAYKIIRLGDFSLIKDDLITLFPHNIPLPKLVQRFISYSCIAPRDEASSFPPVKKNENIISASNLKEQGNDFFKKGDFQKAVETYSSAITLTDNTSSFDPTLLSNRASAFIRLKNFEDALRDAKVYISHRPNCCKGYARKALALVGLNMHWDAHCAAALAYYYERNIFSEFEPFKNFFHPLKGRIYICDASISSPLPLLLNSSSENETDMPSKIIILEPGGYSFQTQIRMCDSILIGINDSASKRTALLHIQGRSNFLSFSRRTLAENVSFYLDSG